MHLIQHSISRRHGHRHRTPKKLIIKSSLLTKPLFFKAHATCTKIWTAATASVEKQKLILDQEENYTFSRMSRSTSTFACKTKMLCKYYLLYKSTNVDAKCKATTGMENKTESYITVQSQQNTSLPTTLSALRTAASCGVPCFSTSTWQISFLCRKERSYQEPQLV